MSRGKWRNVSKETGISLKICKTNLRASNNTALGERKAGLRFPAAAWGTEGNFTGRGETVQGAADNPGGAKESLS